MIIVVGAFVLPLISLDQFEGLWNMVPIGLFVLGVWEVWRGASDLHRMGKQ